MERFAPLVLAILTVAGAAASADHLLTIRAIPELRPPKMARPMSAMLLPPIAPEPLTPPPPPPVFEPGGL